VGIWVVVLEAVAGDEPEPGIEPDDLDALADALADHYPVVAGTRSSYEAEIWVEENTAGGAMLVAQRLWQAAVRDAGLPLWDVLRGEARDARALEKGQLQWAQAPGDEAEPEHAAPEAPAPAPAKKAGDKKAAGKKAAAKKAAGKKAAGKKAAGKKAGAAGAAPRSPRVR
jgi:hypothetical protein